jgi:hypothetical protein
MKALYDFTISTFQLSHPHLHLSIFNFFLSNRPHLEINLRNDLIFVQIDKM